MSDETRGDRCAPPAPRGLDDAAVRAGQRGDAWRFLPTVLQVPPAERPGGLWALVALNSAALGLTEIARDALDRARALLNEPDARFGVTPADLDAIARALEGAPPARIPTAALERTLDANLAARPALAERLAPHRAAWSQRVARERWYRTSDGNVVRLGPASEDDSEVKGEHAWAGAPISVFDALSAARAIVPAPAPDAERAAPPLVYVEGLSPPWLVRDLVENRYTPSSLGASSRVLVVHRSESSALDGLAHADLTGVLAQTRVEIFVGAPATEQLAERLEALSDTGLSGVGLVSPGTTERCEPGIEQVIALAQAGQRARHQRAVDAASARVEGRTPAWWAARYADSVRSGAGIRVLVLSCRYSTYVGSAGQELTDAFTDAGHDARLFIEPDAHSNVTAVGLNEQIASFDPDLIVTFNYPRRSLALQIPGSVPVACWIQDPLPHLFDASNYGGDGAALDFYVGHSYADLRALGLDPRRLLSCPVLASDRVFGRGERRDDLACDIALVTNHGQPPHELFEELCASGAIPVSKRDAVIALLGSLEPAIERPMTGRIRSRLDHVAGEIARELGRSDDDTRALVRRHFLSPIVDRVIRHTVAGWARELAEKTGRTLRVYGRGWERAPGFEAYVHGPVDHADLPDVYASAGVTVHASLSWCLHQRVIETALAGGVPAVLVKADDLCTLQGLFAGAVADEYEPSFSWVDSKCSYVWAIDHPRAALGASMLQRLASRLPERLPFQGISVMGTSGVFPWHASGRAKPEPLASAIDAALLLGDLDEIGFSSPEDFAAIVERAVGSGAWRASISAGIAARARAGFTYEAAAARIPTFLGERLAELARSASRGITDSARPIAEEVAA